MDTEGDAVLKPTKAKNYPLVEVEWLDASSVQGWQQHIQQQPLTNWSAGYLIHKDRESVVVALSCSGKQSMNAYGDAITIPAKIVTKIRHLR